MKSSNAADVITCGNKSCDIMMASELDDNPTLQSLPSSSTTQSLMNTNEEASSSTDDDMLIYNNFRINHNCPFSFKEIATLF